MIEINENIILGSITYNLSKAFGEEYTYYNEEIKQDFKKPSFHISKLNLFSRKGYTGDSYKAVDNEYVYIIKYFSNNTNNLVKDINEKIDKIKETFEYLNIINFEGEEEIISPTRINKMEFNTTDGVLITTLYFSLNGMKYLDKEKLESITIKGNIKNI